MNAQLIRRMREERAWSQEHLAAAAGLSLRTVQRVEAEGRASAETRLSLASAFGVEVGLLSSGEATAAAPAAVERQFLLSRARYRALRLLLLLAALLGFDLHRHASLTWSHWVVLAVMLVLGLRWFKRHFVAPREV